MIHVVEFLARKNVDSCHSTYVHTCKDSLIVLHEKMSHIISNQILRAQSFTSWEEVKWRFIAFSKAMQFTKDLKEHFLQGKFTLRYL